MPHGQTRVTVTDQDIISDPFTGVAHRTRSTTNGVLMRFQTPTRCATGCRI